MNSCAPTARAAASHVLVGRVRTPEGDVVADRAGEQVALLRDDAELGAQRALRDPAQVVAVDQHAPAVGVVEARHQLGERGLAGAGRAHERQGLPRWHVQRDVLERRMLAVVGEGHVVELDLAAQALELDRVRRVADLRLLVEQLEDLVERRHARLVGRVELGERLDRVEEALQVEDERGEHADGHGLVQHLVAAVEQDRGGGDRRQQLDRREVGRVQVDRLHVGLAVLVVQLREALAVAVLLPEGAHHPHAGQRLLQVGRDVRDLLAREPVGARRGDPEDHAAHEQHGEGQEGDQRQAGVEHDQDHRRADQRERGREQGGDALRHELVERLHVVRDARDDHAGLVARVEARSRAAGGARRAGGAGPGARAGRPRRSGRSGSRWRPS